MITAIPRPLVGAVVLVALLGALTTALPARAARLSIPRWDDVTSLSTIKPGPRKHHVMVMDPVGNQVIMWSGENEDEILQDAVGVWILDLCTMQWRKQDTYPKDPNQPILRPAPRHGHVAVILPEQRKMIVMTGSKDGSHDQIEQGAATDNEVWELDLTDFKWRQPIVTGTPPCRRWHSAAVTYGLTNSNAKIYLFGGRTPVPSGPGAPFAINDTWLLRQNGTSYEWVFDSGTCSLSPGNGTGDRPDRRYKHSLVVGREVGGGEDKLYAFGGIYFNDEAAANNVYRGMVTSNPVPDGNGYHSVLWGQTHFSDVGGYDFARIEHSAIYDPVDARMIVYGGHMPPTGGTNETPVGLLCAMTVNSSCETPSGSPPNCWGMLTATGTPPAPRKGHAAVYDPIGDRMIVFGGQLGAEHSSPMTNELWILSFRAISDLAVDAHTSTTVTLEWTRPGLTGGQAPPTCYDVRTSPNAILTDADFTNATPLSPVVGQSQNSNGTWNVFGTVYVPNSSAFMHYSVREGTGTPKAISNGICFKLWPFMECMEELRTELEGSPPGAKLTLSVPNPGGRQFECAVTVPGTEPAVLSVLDVAGRGVERHELAGSSGSRTVRIGEGTGLRPGFYMIVLRQGSSETRRSVIIR